MFAKHGFGLGPILPSTPPIAQMWQPVESLNLRLRCDWYIDLCHRTVPVDEVICIICSCSVLVSGTNHDASEVMSTLLAVSRKLSRANLRHSVWRCIQNCVNGKAIRDVESETKFGTSEFATCNDFFKFTKITTSDFEHAVLQSVLIRLILASLRL